MGRPLIDFINVESIPWVEARIPGSNLLIALRMISRDDVSGATTMMVRMPPGWERDNPGYYDQDEELFYLDGRLETGLGPCTRYSYVFRSRGQLREPSRSLGGCTLLAHFSGRNMFTPASANAPYHEPSRDIGPINIRDMPWEEPRSPGFPGGAGRKTLRWDDARQEGFWILGMLPHWTNANTEEHEFEEENYILEGEIETAEGLMTVGAYLAHPPGHVHGPMRTKPGSLCITRSKGPFATIFRPVADYKFPEE
jgi:hypothetical protein